MLSKNKIKLIKSLDKKKYRQESGCFLAEGNKLVADLLPFFDCELLVARSSWMAQQGDLPVKELLGAEDGDIERASLLRHPQDVIAVFRQPRYEMDKEAIRSDLCLVLDGVQDPGNLGTIIRLADWFGIRHIICSHETVDVYNPKVVQATMGALARVQLFYVSLPEFLAEMSDMPIYGTFLDGENLYAQELAPAGFIVMGNEGNGISEALEPLINHRLYIPNYPLGTPTSESLNVAMATAITCAEFRRRQG